MKKIPLTQGQVSSVDNADFEWLNRWNWRAQRGRNGKFYAVRTGTRPKQKAIYMHRLICGSAAGEKTDHINGDSLNNRRGNLRRCTTAQNSWNSSAHKDNKSGFKGVSWHKYASLWHARIMVFSRQISLGYFSTVEQASRAYKVAARKYHGEFSRV